MGAQESRYKAGGSRTEDGLLKARWTSPCSSSRMGMTLNLLGSAKGLLGRTRQQNYLLCDLGQVT